MKYTGVKTKTNVSSQKVNNGYIKIIKPQRSSIVTGFHARNITHAALYICMCSVTKCTTELLPHPPDSWPSEQTKHTKEQQGSRFQTPRHFEDADNWMYTYSIAMPQCFPALSPAAWKPDRPIRATVGVIVKGPMYLSRIPGRPSAPIHTSTREETMMAPWICSQEEEEENKKKE